MRKTEVPGLGLNPGLIGAKQGTIRCANLLPQRWHMHATNQGFDQEECYPYLSPMQEENDTISAVPDLPLPGPWARMKFRAHSLRKIFNMGGGGLFEQL